MSSNYPPFISYTLPLSFPFLVLLMRYAPLNIIFCPYMLLSLLFVMIQRLCTIKVIISWGLCLFLVIFFLRRYRYVIFLVWKVRIVRWLVWILEGCWGFSFSILKRRFCWLLGEGRSFWSRSVSLSFLLLVMCFTLVECFTICSYYHDAHIVLQ